MLGDMTMQRMDNVAIVVDDLDAAVAFFTELGMELGHLWCHVFDVSPECDSG